MSKGRRNFLKNIALSGVSIPLFNLNSFALPHNLISKEFNNSVSDLNDKEFWDSIRAQYTLSEIINMNNGGCSPQPKIVQETFKR